MCYYYIHLYWGMDFREWDNIITDIHNIITDILEIF